MRSGKRFPTLVVERIRCAKPPQIYLVPPRDIPLGQLVLSQSNEPRIKADASVDELVEDDPHRLDKFPAFKALREKGLGEEAIASAFLVSQRIVNSA